MRYDSVMDRDLLAHLPVVRRVAERRSFARAAAELGLSPSAVSHAVRLFEERLRTPLFARTTRSVSLTEAGQTFLAAAIPALDALEEAASMIQAADGNVTGTVRINAPSVAMPLALTRIIARLAGRHPRLVVEVTSDEALVDIVRAGHDMGVRLGEMIAQDMVAVRLTPPFKAIMAASPEYLRLRGKPRALADLKTHNCIGFRQLSGGGVYAWDLADEGKDVAVKVSGSVRVTEPLLAIELASQSVGIAYGFEPLMRDAIQAGRLEQVLPAASIEEPGLFLYFPRRATQAPKIRAFVDAVRA